MAVAICTHCDFVHHYLARTGSRLKEMHCPQCLQRTLHRARWGGDRYERDARGYRERGHLVTCAVCQAKRRSRAGNVRFIKEPFLAPREHGESKVFPGMQWVCWTHETHPAPVDAACQAVAGGGGDRGLAAAAPALKSGHGGAGFRGKWSAAGAAAAVDVVDAQAGDIVAGDVNAHGGDVCL